MDNRPIRDERLLEAIEACRPGSDDLADPALTDLADQLETDPELRELYERLQRVDGRLAAVFADVPVPEGLAQRIIDRLAVARAERAASAGEEEATETSAPQPVTPVAPRPPRLSRRWLLAAGGLVTVAAGLLTAVWIFNRPPQYTEQAVLDAAWGLFSKDESPEQGHLLSDLDHPPAADYPISREVFRMPGTRWRSISGFLGRGGVAYDLPEPDGTPRATLYVVRLTVPDVGAKAPPLRPQRDTGGYCVAAWQEGELLYVLVVRGDSGAYRRCLAPTGLVT